MITKDQLAKQVAAIEDLRKDFDVCYPMALQDEKDLTHLEVFNVMLRLFGGTDSDMVGTILSELKEAYPSPEQCLKAEMKRAEDYFKFLCYLLNHLQKAQY
jgi:hypothetical protein